MDPPLHPVSLEGPDDAPSNIAEPVALASLEGDSDPRETPSDPVVPMYTPKKSLMSRLSVPLLIVIIIAVPVALVFAVFNRTQRTTPEQQSNFSTQQVNLKSLIPTTPAKDLTGTLTVNGQLQVAKSLQVSPTAKPVDPTAGQIYYDKSNNQLGYYNGKAFVYLQGGSTIINNNTTVVNNSTNSTLNNITNSTINTVTNTTINNYYTTVADPSPPAILLQDATPGTVQNGNFAISGTGTIGIANIGTGNIATGVINVGNIDVGNINTGTITNATIGAATINTAMITTATIDVANITTGNIGVVHTTDIESDGSAFAVNQYAAIPGGQAATAGYTGVGSSSTNPVGMFGTMVSTGSSGGPLHSISVYVGNSYHNNTISGPSGAPANASFEVGIYSDNGDLVNNAPKTLLTQAGPFYLNNHDFALNSWNTFTTPTLPLQAFTNYWIVFHTLGSWSSYDAIDFKYKTNSADGNSYSFTDQSWCSWGAWGMPASGPLPTCFGNTGPYYSKSNLSAYFNYTTDPSTGGAAAMFSLSATGQAAFRATEDSLNAFKIQNAASATTIFNVDTYDMRVSIGKPTADYLLDIGNGDVNMVSGRSLRFGGVKVLTASTTATSLAGGTITLQGPTTTTGTAAVQGAATFASSVSITGATTHTGATTLNGATAVNNTFANKVTSATAFTIQNASAANLFVADTSTMTINVTGTDTTFANLTLNNTHFKSTQTTTPTISIPNNCGTSPTAAVATGSTDSAGSFTITTGTGGTSSTCDTTLTFRKAYGAAPKSIIISGKGTVDAVQRQAYVVSSTATTFTVSFAMSTGGVDGMAYQFNYWVVE